MQMKYLREIIKYNKPHLTNKQANKPNKKLEQKKTQLIKNIKI